jgi:ribosomal protein S18 acetylase RimI-like enzyme
MVDYVEMRCDLTRRNIPAPDFPPEIAIQPVQVVAVDDLFACYRAAFAAGDAQFFFQQNAREQRDFFDTLGLAEAVATNAAAEPASVVLRHEARVIGFSLVLRYGAPTNRHISCMCVLPAYQGRGLGKQLLWLIMQRVKAGGGQTITLGTEPAMRAYHLYRKHGFTVIASPTPDG